jgi:mono/diheme cytochrome c family protein
MQVKVIIGTVAFMLTMIILGYAALREPGRLEDFAGAAHGRSVEKGAEIYANNCVSCHGIDGDAQEGCTNPDTGDTSCVGRPLNSYWLLCTDQPQRLVETNWPGTTEQFVLQTIAAGRTGTLMPAWLSDFGGPMRQDQVQNVTDFVLNWGGPDAPLCQTVPVSTDWADTADLDAFLAELEPGDPENGAALYNSQACVGCHGSLDGATNASLGPSLVEIDVDGADRIDGYSAKQYVYESILDPNAFIAPECPTGACVSPSLMRGDYSSALTEQDMADLLAYLVGE